MKKYFIISILSVILSANSCTKFRIYQETVASFSMNKTTAHIGETIVFTNSSKHAESYQWVFGDGQFSYEKNPTHSYSSAGTFTIELNATGMGNIPPVDQATRTIIITVP
jgi:PKD repeat protein